MNDQTQLGDKFQLAAQYIDALRQEINKHIIGYDTEIQQLLACLIAGGHCLLVGMPGVGKTHLTSTLAQALGVDFKRIQATPDLMPADIIGTEILNPQQSGFEFVKGPIFCQFLMIDEINRATPRTQSALLEAMQERQVTVSGNKFPLPQPFQVVATQNPIEQDGTFQLPEAQIDRFMCRIDIPYPNLDQERQIIYDKIIDPTPPAPVANVVNAQFLLQASQLAQHMPISEGILHAAINMTRKTRDLASNEQSGILRGAGPRAGQYLVAMSRALALVRGNMLVSAQETMDCVLPVMRHRIAWHYGIGQTQQYHDIEKKLHDMMYQELSSMS